MTMIPIHPRQQGVLRLLAAAALCAAATVAQAAELPDFTGLVKANAPAVVNIRSVREAEDGPIMGGNAPEELEEFFRRFMPPGAQPRRPNPQAMGSGFVISEDGYLLTNNHVIDGADEILVRFSDRRELEAELVGADPRSDLALLKVDAKGLHTVRFGRSSELDVGEWVLAIGSPFGFDYSVTQGIVSAKGRSLPTEFNENYVPFIQTDVAINPGNSGGPLFNLDGEVVGINSQIYSRSGGFMGVSFAIPIDVAMEVVEQIKSTGRVSRGWLGVVIQEVNRDLAESFGLDRPHGALVAQVLDGSPAEAGGIQEGDIITAFNGEEIDFSSDLPHLVGRAAAGSEAELTVVRSGKQITLELEIGELADRGEDFLGQRSGGQEAPSKLGLRIEALPPALAERLDVEGGVRVQAATGAAAEAGIRPDDVITRLNNREVRSVEDFTEIAAGLTPGRSVPVLVVGGETAQFSARKVSE